MSAVNHFILENDRALKSARAIVKADMDTFFLLQKATHGSLVNNCRVDNETVHRLIVYMSERENPFESFRVLGPGGASNILLWVRAKRLKEAGAFLKSTFQDLKITYQKPLVVEPGVKAARIF